MEATAKAAEGILGIDRDPKERDIELPGPWRGLFRLIVSELRKARPVLAALVAGTLAYGLGHAGLAISAALLGRELALSGGDGGLARGTGIVFAYLGLSAAVVKVSAATVLAFTESRAAAQLADALRQHAVSSLLDRGLHDAAPRVLATIAVRIREVETAVTAGVFASAKAVAQLVPLALALIVLSPPLALAALAGVVPFALALARLRRHWRGSSEKAQSELVELHAGVDDLVKNLDLWRSYGAGRTIERAIREASDRAGRSAARVEAGRAALSGANEVLGALAVIGVIALGSALGLARADAGVVAFLALVFMAYRPLRDLGDARSASLRGGLALDALGRLLPASSFASGGGACTAPQHALERLELDGFCAAERGPKTTLSVEPGEIVCVVGPTGSGKTTLLRALLGLEPARGVLRYGGRELTHAEVGPVARPFAWVPQDAPLVTATLAANIALFGGDESRAREALEQIGATSLLSELGSSVIGPGGRTLSGGERRQVAIARALCTGLPVLLLDEPSEGLDSLAERGVLDALARLRGRRSVILVSHRADVATIADRAVGVGATGAPP